MRAAPRPAPTEEIAVELRHLDALLAIADEGSFTAAADVLHTVQSNVSDMVRQLERDLVALVPRPLHLGDGPVAFSVLAGHRMILPPVGNPLRAEIDQAARAAGVELNVPVEVEGVRLIADFVAAGAGITIIPATAVPN